MKKKLVVMGIVGSLVLGGAVGVGAFSKEAEVPYTKAKEIATQQVKGSHVEEIELDRKNGELFYEVELEGTHDDDVEVKINANTGEVVYVENARYDDDQPKPAKSDDKRMTSKKTVNISMEEAIQIAKNDTPGKIEEVELDDDFYYEIEMKHEGKEIEFEISAIDGKILDKEVDDDDDDRD